MSIEFEYYRGEEANQFSFYRVPKVLFQHDKFKRLSSDAKLLYGLMLDRMSLSARNQWLDDENRVFIIYTIENIAEDLGCGRDKAIKTLAELDSKKGIGLLEKKKRGLGKPDIIYVKNFIVKEDKRKETIGNYKKSEKSTSRNRKVEEVGKIDFKASKNPTAGSRRNRSQEVGQNDTNNTNINNTDLNEINHNQSMEERKIEDYIELIKKNLEYDFFMENGTNEDKEFLQEIFDLVCDVVCVKRKTVRIGQEEYPYRLVKERFLRLNQTHVGYVKYCLSNHTKKIHNIKAYLITTLYNAPSTINHFYQQEVNHDIFG